MWSPSNCYGWGLPGAGVFLLPLFLVIRVEQSPSISYSRLDITEAFILVPSVLGFTNARALTQALPGRQAVATSHSL